MRYLDLSKPVIMGVLNVTPDSFSDGGAFATTDVLRACIDDYHQSGAVIIDVGAESSRPGAALISADEELDRLSMVFNCIADYPDIVWSLDTTKAAVAAEGLRQGFRMINDVSGYRVNDGMCCTPPKTCLGPPGGRETSCNSAANASRGDSCRTAACG